MSPEWVLLTMALLAGGILIGWPLWKACRRRGLRSRPLPAHWRAITEDFLPLYAHLPAPLRGRLDGFIQQFLAEKIFIGCNGLEVTLQMRLAVASQACLLVLGREVDFYEDLHSILLYPEAFVAPREEQDEAGVVTRHRETLTGEAWDTSQVIFSWEDVRGGVRERGSGYNVVLHEFAHCLDARDGDANGAPLLDSGADHQRWSAIMRQEYERLCEAADRGEETLLDPYGAQAPAEFFAVATESFFEQPLKLRTRHPALYEELMRYYRLDPAAWTQGRGA